MAPRCSTRCGCYDRRYDCANGSRPGAASEVIPPETALGRVERTLRLDSHLRVTEVAGLDGPLTDPATLETFRLIHARFPKPLFCLSTNGLVLSDASPGLSDYGVSTLTVAVNTCFVVCVGHIYRTAGSSADAGAMTTLLSVQQKGAVKAAGVGFTVKINIIAIPGFNTGEIEEIICWAARVGAAVMNLMSLIPQAGFRDNEPPSQALLEALRAGTRTHIPQLTHCRQCKADAVGVLGEMNRIGCL